MGFVWFVTILSSVRGLLKSSCSTNVVGFAHLTGCGSVRQAAKNTKIRMNRELPPTNGSDSPFYIIK